MMFIAGDLPVHCTTVGVMTPGLRVAVVDLYIPRAMRTSDRAERAP